MMQFGDDTLTHDLARENETLRTEVERMTRLLDAFHNGTETAAEVERLRADAETFKEECRGEQLLAEERAAEIERLTRENWQLKGALGYEVPGNIPPGDFICGLCDAKSIEVNKLRAEVARLNEQVSRDDEHYQAAMAMAEKHRKNWVEACQEREQLRTELATVIERTGYHLLRPKP